MSPQNIEVEDSVNESSHNESSQPGIQNSTAEEDGTSSRNENEAEDISESLGTSITVHISCEPSLPPPAYQDPKIFPPIGTIKFTKNGKSRIGYIIQQKHVVITAFAILSIVTAVGIMYLHDSEKYNPEYVFKLISGYKNYIAVPIVVVVVLVGILSWNGIKQYNNTQAYTLEKDKAAVKQIQENCQEFKDPDKKNMISNVEEVNSRILLKIYEEHKEKIAGKIIKSVSLKYDNGAIPLGKYDYGAISEFVLSTIPCKGGLMDVKDLKFNKVEKIESVLNNRPIRITAPLISCIVINAVVLCELYVAQRININIGEAEHASNYLQCVKDFYLNSTTGLMLLTVSCMTILLVTYFSLHYLNKTDCHSKMIEKSNNDDIGTINKKFIDYIKNERTEALTKNYSNGKGSSLMLSQVIINYYSGPNTINNII
ncbi:hypothetical protein BIY23_00915 [Wolbachia pipientis]|uniref:Uncharacterized protein n=1 Tax=Wolbachia pipientis TaxID=955 RepID=A0A1E7QKN2_WOLPI|nr:hypothetical protein [Wolbachia pipientis]OEY87035.1 hypothetical protein BIY23_00915 [Wolbachia pipientis]